MSTAAEIRKPSVHAHFDEGTNTVSYIVGDPESATCAVVDPVLDFDPKAGRTSTASADAVVEKVRELGWTVEWILETHAHADHLSAAPYIKQHLGGKIAIGEHIREVQQVFRDIFNLEKEFLPDGRQFDHLFAEGDRFTIGKIEASVLHTPGHTPACLTYVIGDAAFVGDTLFMPDYGTARCDFPGGSARQLYRSIQKVLSLPDETRIFLCHDYPPESREPTWETTVAEEKAKNIHVHEGVTEEEFVQMRETRDATLSMPTLILPSIQVNIRAGELPPPEDNGTRYMKLPINQL
ncbi:MBL fold metallo-hydrolase [Aquibaculum sediminis]|uniref:MBL fold metallo-hydrolase n=1 Tax=Aquibaculum sediminis TaxID=3231907 RepID=UPI003456A42E